MESHTWVSSVKSATGKTLKDSVVYSADALQDFSDTVVAGAVKEIVIGIVVSKIKSMAVESSKALTLKTNSVTSPAQTFTLAAGKMLGWNTDRHDACPLTTNVTILIFDNSAGTEDAAIEGTFLVDYSG